MRSRFVGKQTRQAGWAAFKPQQNNNKWSSANICKMQNAKCFAEAQEMLSTRRRFVVLQGVRKRP